MDPRKHRRNQERSMQPQPEIIQDIVLDKDTEIAQLRAQIALLEQALQAPVPQPAASGSEAASDSASEPELVEAEFQLPPMLEMGLQMLQTPEGRKTLAGMVASHLSKVDLQVRNDGVSVAIHSSSAVFRADAWMESTKAVASSGDATAPKPSKTIPLWGEGSLDYSDFF